MSHEEFIKIIAKYLADEEYMDCRIMPSVIISHAGLVSEWGKSRLAINANNLFGILGSTTEGDLYTLVESCTTSTGKPVEVERRYRSYQSWKDSVHDFINTVLVLPKYDSLRDKDCSNCSDREIEKTIGQYHVYPKRYGTLMRSTITRYNLKKYDVMFGHRNPYNISQVGDCGEIVKWIQYELNVRGYRTGVDIEDGIFEYNMMRLVMQFQRDNGIPPTGIVDLKTMSMLSSIPILTERKQTNEVIDYRF